jgi:hypothetical protein
MQNQTASESLTNPSRFARAAAHQRQANFKPSSSPAGAGPGSLPGKPAGPSRTSPEWQELYFRWYAGGLGLPRDEEGNTVAEHAVLLPFPDTAGDGTPGHLEVTLRAGQSWVLPLRVMVGSSYSDGTAADEFLPKTHFESLDISFEIDGRKVVSPSNVMDYYSQSTFAPPIPFDAAPVKALIWMQVIGVVHGPLEIGAHKLKLDVKDTRPLPPAFGGGAMRFHNTWSINVLADGRTSK